MITYKEYSPTQFDSHIYLDDLESWLVLPTVRTRDSDSLEESNFECALDMLGGESKTVQVLKFNHWGPGWYEIIIIDPTDTKTLEIAEDIERSLENYPVLDEDNYSQKEMIAEEENWNCWGYSSFRDDLIEEIKNEGAEEALIEELTDYLDTLDADELWTIWRDMEGENYGTGDDPSFRVYLNNWNVTEFISDHKTEAFNSAYRKMIETEQAKHK